MPVKVTEAEAVRRGWIKSSPPAESEAKPKSRTVISLPIATLLWMIAAWWVGLVMGVMLAK